MRHASITIGRLLIKLNRVEALTCLLLAVGVSIASLVVTMELNGLHADRQCFIDWITSAPTDFQCAAGVNAWAVVDEGHAAKVMIAMALLPFIVGGVTGSILVAREIEDGTAAFSWSLSASRNRWLRLRLLPALAFVVALTGTAAMASYVLAETRSVGGIWSSLFDMASLYGLPVVMRGVAALLIAVFVGSILGRTLPTVIATTALIAVVAFGVAQVQYESVGRTQLVLGIGEPGYLETFMLVNPDTAVGFVDASGNLLTFDQAASRAPQGTQLVPDWVQSNFQFVPLGVKGERILAWQVVESVAFGSLSVAAYALTLGILSVRRPQ